MRGFIREIDQNLTKSVQARSKRWQPVFEVATVMGDPLIVSGIAFFGLAVALRRGQDLLAWAFAATVLAAGINLIIKLLVRRVRPGKWSKLPTALFINIKSYSLPSSHAFGSIVTYGFIALLTLKYVSEPLNYLIFAMFWGLIALIGLSRVYLGPHYPTDVIAGWLLGGLALAIIAVVFIS